MWIILGFDKRSEALVFERDLPGVTWQDVRRALQIPSEWRAGSKLLGPEDGERLLEQLGIDEKLDFQRIDYFVEEVAD